MSPIPWIYLPVSLYATSPLILTAADVVADEEPEARGTGVAARGKGAPVRRIVTPEVAKPTRTKADEDRRRGKLTLTNFNFTHWQNGHVEEQIHLPDAEALYKLMQERFGLGVDDPKHGFTLAELTAVMAGFDTHPQAGK